jgi:hypothetical protein
VTAVKSAGTAAAEAVTDFAAAVRGNDSPYGLDDLGMALTDIAEAIEYAARACAEYIASCPGLASGVKREMEDAAAYAGVLAGHCDSRLNYPLVMGRGPGRGRRGWLGRRRYEQRD